MLEFWVFPSPRAAFPGLEALLDVWELSKRAQTSPVAIKRPENCFPSASSRAILPWTQTGYVLRPPSGPPQITFGRFSRKREIPSFLQSDQPWLGCLPRQGPLLKCKGGKKIGSQHSRWCGPKGPNKPGPTSPFFRLIGHFTSTERPGPLPWATWSNKLLVIFRI